MTIVQGIFTQKEAWRSGADQVRGLNRVGGRIVPEGQGDYDVHAWIGDII